MLLKNPPFGGKEAQACLACKTGATQALFLQRALK
jgi:hypothetical protein